VAGPPARFNACWNAHPLPCRARAIKGHILDSCNDRGNPILTSEHCNRAVPLCCSSFACCGVFASHEQRQEKNAGHSERPGLIALKIWLAGIERRRSWLGGVPQSLFSLDRFDSDHCALWMNSVPHSRLRWRGEATIRRCPFIRQSNPLHDSSRL
jgi:hypothetical protein